MPILTMVKTCMPRCISTGLLASRTLSRANCSSKHILNNVAGALVFFNGTTDDDGVGFVWHRIASFRHTASLLVYRCTRNPRDKVSEDQPRHLLSGEGILYNTVPRKRKKCNKTIRFSSSILRSGDFYRCYGKHCSQRLIFAPDWN